MRWLVITSVMVFLPFIVAGALVYEFYYAAAAVFAAVTILGLILHLGLLCPRCGTHVTQRRRGFFGRAFLITPACITCGRGKSDVFPFQRFIRPEGQ